MKDPRKADLPAASRMGRFGEPGRVLGVAVFLVVGTFSADRLMSNYLDRLVSANNIGLWTRVVRYIDTAASVFLVLQIVVVILFYRLGNAKFEFRGLIRRPARASLAHLVYGVLTGLAVYLAGLPFLLRFDKDVQFIDLMVGNFFTVRTVLLILLLVGVIPLATEIVFRGIIFGTLVKKTNPVAALVASALLFAFVWPLFNSVTALLLGVATAFLYYRSRELLPGVLANMVVTISCTSTLFWRALVRG